MNFTQAVCWKPVESETGVLNAVAQLLLCLVNSASRLKSVSRNMSVVMYIGGEDLRSMF